MSNSEAFNRASSIFDELCDLAPEQRAERLSELCGDDDALRAEVESLLKHDASPHAFIDGADSARAFELLAGDLRDAAPPESIGRYRILREVGRGGMGVVYEGEQENPKRCVAVKVVRRGLATREMLRRFRHEAQILANLRHPGIAHIYEAGAAEVGDATLPFIAMEFVEGDRLDAYIQKRDLTVRDRLELVARVCDAVQHAHVKGVIHRDLKPANILVVEEQSATDSRSDSAIIADPIGQPKVLDFGIARATDADRQATTLQTSAGQIVGTLGYMGPEQLEGRSEDIDVRSDVYALGAIAYRLLSGRAPHDLSGKSIAEAVRAVKEESPPALGSIDGALRGEIQTIVAKAMEKEPERRYPSAGELGEDIRRHLRGAPILAHPPSAAYQFRKFARRNTGLVAALGATVLAIALGFLGIVHFLIEAQRQRDDALHARTELERVVAFQSELLADLDVRAVADALMDGLRKEFTDSIAEMPEHERAPVLAAFEDNLDQINSANLARSFLEDTLAERASMLIEEGFGEDPLTDAELRISLGEIYHRLNLTEKALRQLTIAHEAFRARLGDDDARTHKAAFYLGRTQHAAGDLTEAERLLSHVAERAAPDDQHRIKGLNILGRVYQDMRRFDDARACFEAVIEAAPAVLTPAHWIILSGKNNLAALLLSQGEIDEALALFEEIQEARHGLFSDDSRTTITLRNNIMAALFQQGRLEEAERHARDVLTSYSRALGDNHHRTILGRNNVGRILLDTGRPEESLEFFMRLDRDARAHLPPMHNVRLTGMGNLIDALTALGRHQEAEPYARELLALRREAEPRIEFQISNALEQLGICLIETDRYTEAEPFLRECVAIREGINADHWLSHWARCLHGAALAGMEDFGTAAPILSASLAGLQELESEIPSHRLDSILADARRFAAGVE